MEISGLEPRRTMMQYNQIPFEFSLKVQKLKMSALCLVEVSTLAWLDFEMGDSLEGVLLFCQ